MSSLTVKPLFSIQSLRYSPSSTLVFLRKDRLFQSASIHGKTNFPGSLVLKAHSFESSDVDAESKDKNNPNAADSKPPNGTVHKSRKDILLEYVQNVQPDFMEFFIKRAPQQVVEAMRQTVTNMMGTLPPQFFSVTVTTVAENLAQLMYSVMMTGYMFRNAQFRLEMQQSLQLAALPYPEAQDTIDVPDFAPGTQKKVSGEVIRWNNVSGAEKIDAVKYIELLEAEVEELNRQIERKSANGQNEIFEYLKTLEPQNLKELTSSAGEDVVLAMNTFIERLLAVSDPSQMKVAWENEQTRLPGNLVRNIDDLERKRKETMSLDISTL
ncbi:unnamed protein product [Cuscuta epithymum]|uniref:Uncharacterized protein n=1 Tax=Cuscuta epithymum TaxID=186058 RepID=A0AAV0F000_9ASTE|nr:unnamed protein product [Cuscuta epithymum]CAH9128837.1 unnamed protein product [Cuscuta epithymum]